MMDVGQSHLFLFVYCAAQLKWYQIKLRLTFNVVTGPDDPMEFELVLTFKARRRLPSKLPSDSGKPSSSPKLKPFQSDTNKRVINNE